MTVSRRCSKEVSIGMLPLAFRLEIMSVSRPWSSNVRILSDGLVIGTEVASEDRCELGIDSVTDILIRQSPMA